jgi:hypothetical protein
MSGGASGAQEMPAPKPGPEHEVLKADVGTWDAKVEMTPAPGMALMVSKGVETNVMGCGGLCLISDFKGEIAPGQPFHGHGVTVWDPAKKKYVGTWTDSMSTGMAMGESTYDAKTKKAEGWMHMTDPTGQPIKSRMVVEYSSPANRVLTGWMVLPDGKEFQNMRISYTRRK